MQLGPEVHVIREAHRLAGSGLVVDHLDLAVADIVDAVDLADHGRAIDLQTEALLNRKRAQAADELHSGDRPDVVAEERADLPFLALAVKHALHAREVSVEVSLRSEERRVGKGWDWRAA